MNKTITRIPLKRKNYNRLSVGFKKLLFTTGLAVASITAALAQQTISIGTVQDFKNQLGSSGTHRGAEAQIQTPDATFPAQLNRSLKVDNVEIMVGELKGIQGSHFRFTITDGKLEGTVLIPALKKAYRYSTPANGNVQVENTDIHKLICVDLDQLNASQSGIAVQAVPPTTSAVYHLQSLAGATAVAYLDFDGEVSTTTYWNGGTTIDAQPGNFSEADITNIFNLVSEDYRPFKVNITTDLAIFNAAPVNRRMRCIFTPTNTAAPGSGGVAYVNSFSWNNDTPCWVFNGGAKAAGEAASHELGHTFGLSHDGRTTPVEDYYGGAGIWAPIMGVGYSKGLVQWSKGEYPNANRLQDDVAIIANTTNGFGYKADEDGGTAATAKPLAIGTTGAITGTQNYGIITTSADVDVYSFTTSGGAVTLSAAPAAVYADLDILLTLTNSAGTVVATANPTTVASGSQSGSNPLTGLAATISTTLAAGTYYLKVDGAGQGDLTTGYSDYASIGEYRISGTVPVGTVNQAPVVSITAPANGASFIAPATITITANATDDGSVAKVDFYNGITLLGSDATSPYSFAWTNVAAGTYTINAIATDNVGLVSNTASITVTVTNPNQAPVVTITSPANNASFTASASITINTTATDDGTVAKVDFYNGTTLLGTDATSPYSFTWNNVSAGSYTIRAIATDNVGLASAAASIAVSVTNANQAPVVTITSPANNSSFVAPASITINATATDDGTVAKIDFYNGSTLLGTDATSPYSFAWTNVAAGTYTIRAIATDNLGLASAAASIAVSVANANQAPVVTITSPANNASFVAPASITINATATDDGTVAKVDFYNGSTLLGTDAASPYSFAWTNVAAGTYTINVTATDNVGATTTASVTVVVSAAPSAIATVYKHCDYSTAGYTVALALGNYNLTQLRALGVLNDDISSVKITSGYEIVLYKDDNFSNSALIIRSDVSCLVNNNFNDAASSAIVRLSTAAALAANTETESSSLSLFPNPASNRVAIQFHNIEQTTVSVSIHDSYGNNVGSVDLQDGEQINVSHFPTGIYTLRAVVGQELLITKFIVH